MTPTYNDLFFEFCCVRVFFLLWTQLITMFQPIEFLLSFGFWIFCPMWKIRVFTRSFFRCLVFLNFVASEFSLGQHLFEFSFFSSISSFYIWYFQIISVYFNIFYFENSIFLNSEKNVVNFWTNRQCIEVFGALRIVFCESFQIKRTILIHFNQLINSKYQFYHLNNFYFRFLNQKNVSFWISFPIFFFKHATWGFWFFWFSFSSFFFNQNQFFFTHSFKWKLTGLFEKKNNIFE